MASILAASGGCEVGTSCGTSNGFRPLFALRWRCAQANAGPMVSVAKRSHISSTAQDCQDCVHAPIMKVIFSGPRLRLLSLASLSRWSRAASKACPIACWYASVAVVGGGISSG